MPTATCPACAGAIQPGWKACPHCGRVLADTTAPAPINYAALGPAPAPAGPPVVPLACPNCGGNLPVPTSGTTYLQCPYCHTALQVRHTGAGVSLELAQQMGAAIGQAMGAQMGTQAAEQELTQLRMQLPDLRRRAEALQHTGSLRDFEAARAVYYTAQAREGQLSRQLGQQPMAAPDPAPWWAALQTGYWGRLGPILLLGLALVLWMLFNGAH